MNTTVKLLINILIIGITLTTQAADKVSITQVTSDAQRFKNTLSSKITSHDLVTRQRPGSDTSCQLTSQINRDGSISLVCESTNTTATASWDITGWSPNTVGKAGGVLNVSGFNMPALSFRIGNQALDVESTTPSLKVVRLPMQEVEGPLIAVRNSDGQEVTLTENYSVHFPFHYFNADNNGFDWTNGYLLSAASMAVYDNSSNFPATVTTRFASMGLTVDYADDTNSLGVDMAIAHNDDIVLVAIRGTQMSEDWEDLAIDGLHPLIPAPPNWGVFGVHTGFFVAASSVFDLVADTVTPLLNGNRKLWITGHSLGGAMSNLIAYRLQIENNINVEGVHTFGSPRVGNYYWMLANKLVGLADKTWRWAAEGDTVTTLPYFDVKFYFVPVPTPGQIYFHVGHTNTLFADGNIEIDGIEQVTPQLDPQDFYNGLFDEHMSYAPRIYEALHNEIDGEVYGVMPGS